MKELENYNKEEFDLMFKEYNSGDRLESNIYGDSHLLPIVYFNKNRSSVELQFHGWSITLKDDGTYFFNDTTGG